MFSTMIVYDMYIRKKVPDQCYFLEVKGLGHICLNCLDCMGVFIFSTVIACGV